MFDVSAAVDFALSRAGSPYVYGGTGRMCTPGYRKERMRQYPAQAAAIRSACPVLSGRAAGCSTCGWAGKPCYDCAQLVRAALLRAGAKRVPSGASSLWRMEEMWESKGRIDLSLASSLFCVLFRASAAGDRHPMRHAGISLGDGRAVDARSHARGVLITSLDKYPWTDMAFPKGMPGGALPLPPASAAPAGRSVLLTGSSGEGVRALQRRLMSLGFPLPRFGADGIFGRETAAALTAFQFSRGLAPTGALDAATLSGLALSFSLCIISSKGGSP